MKDATFGPVYCAMYPGLAAVTRRHGYALAVHGSLARDFDLVCIPWAETVGAPSEVVASICAEFSIRQIGEPETKRHGRQAWTLSVGFGECAIDLSFMPAMGVA